MKIQQKIELRHNEDGLDEALLYVNGVCVFHLEKMDKNHWWMALYADKDNRAAISLTSRGLIRATVNEEPAPMPGRRR